RRAPQRRRRGPLPTPVHHIPRPGGIPRWPVLVLTVRVTLNESGTDGLRLFSGDAVELDIRIARLGSRALGRLGALVAQIVLSMAMEIIVALIIEAAGPVADGALSTALAIVAVVIVWIGYPIVFESLSGGRTLGKLVMGLRVIRDDGGPIRFRHALTR